MRIRLWLYCLFFGRCLFNFASNNGPCFKIGHDLVTYTYRCMVLESQQQVNHSHSVRTKRIACTQTCAVTLHDGNVESWATGQR